MAKRKHGNNMFIYVVFLTLPSVTKLIFITEPTIWQSLEAPQHAKEDKQTVPEVKVNTNGNEQQNGQPHVKKKLNKQERKEARRQKNGKATNNAENTLAQEPEEAVSDKKKKKDRKRKRDCEDGREEQNGHSVPENVTSRKKTKGKSDIFLKA